MSEKFFLNKLACFFIILAKKCKMSTKISEVCSYAIFYMCSMRVLISPG